MARVDGCVKVMIDGPWSKIVHDFVVQCEVCLKTLTLPSPEHIATVKTIHLFTDIIYTRVRLLPRFMKL